MNRKEYMREYQLKWMKRRRLFYLNLLGGKCAYCGINDNLQFDHIQRSDKRENIKKLLSCKIKNAIKEIKKCQVLCSDCHIKKTVKENTKPLIHGTSNAYNQKGCRCEYCKEWRRLEARNYRKQKNAIMTMRDKGDQHTEFQGSMLIESFDAFSRA